jgi:hypothetical protein
VHARQEQPDSHLLTLGSWGCGECVRRIRKPLLGGGCGFPCGRPAEFTMAALIWLSYPRGVSYRTTTTTRPQQPDSRPEPDSHALFSWEPQLRGWRAASLEAAAGGVDAVSHAGRRTRQPPFSLRQPRPRGAWRAAIRRPLLGSGYGFHPAGVPNSQGRPDLAHFPAG